MKHGIRAGSVLLLALLLLSALAACGGQLPNSGQAQNNQPSTLQGNERSLYEHGLEVVDTLAEMARSEDYVALNLPGAMPEMTELLMNAGQGDFSAPKTVYRLTLPESTALAWAAAEAGIDLEAFPPDLRELVETKLLSAIATQINAQAGSATLAASAICTAQKLFVSEELTENMVYLYTYENAVPVAVSFTGGEDGAVCASGMFILNSRFTTDAAADMAQLLSEYAEEFGIVVEEVAP